MGRTRRLLSSVTAFVLALFMLAISIVVLRTGALGRWVGYLGAACSTITIAAVVAQVGAYATPLGHPLGAVPGSRHLARTEPRLGEQL